MRSIDVPGVGPIQFPDNMSDEQIIQAIERDILPGVSGRTQAAPTQGLAPATQQAPAPQRGFFGNVATTAGDVAASAVTGAGGAVSGLGGLVGIAGLGYDNPLSRAGRSVTEFGQGLMSPELTEKREALSRAIQEAESQGLVGEARAAFSAIAENPSLLAFMTVEQILPFVLSAGVGRGASAVGQIAARRAAAGGGEAAERAILQAGQRAGQVGAVGTAAGLQGGSVAEQTYQDVMGLPAETIQQSPNYQELLRTMSPDDARAAIADRAAREAGLLAGGISVGAMSLMPSAERAMFSRGVSQSAMRRALGVGTGEAVSEAIEEGGGQFAQNLAVQRQADEERALGRGVGGAAATGAVLGGVMGAGVGALQRPPEPPSTEPGAGNLPPELRGAIQDYVASREPETPDLTDSARLVTENLPVTTEQFLGATERDQEILLSRARREAEGRAVDDVIFAQSGPRADAFRFEEGRDQPMDDGRTQAEFLRERTEDMVLEARQPPPSTATEDSLREARRTQFAPRGTQAEQTVRAAQEIRAERKPPAPFFPLVENFIEGHVRTYGDEQPISVSALQQYVQERTGRTLSLGQARGILDTYYTGTQEPLSALFPAVKSFVDMPSSKRPMKDDELLSSLQKYLNETTGNDLSRRQTGEALDAYKRSVGRTVIRPIASLGAPMVTSNIPRGSGWFLQRSNDASGFPTYRAVAAKGTRTDETGFPVTPSRPTPPIPADESGFARPQQAAGGQGQQASSRQAPEASALQLGAEQAATQVEAEPSPADARLSRRVEAQNKINALYLDKLKGMGAQGRLIRNGLVDALKNRSLSAEQVYGAFTAADVLAPLMPAGANHRIEFTKEILPNKQLAEAISRSGGNPTAALQGLRTRPSDAGLEGIITLSLAPDMMPYLRETAAHEAFHVLQDYYGKYDPQFKKLMDQGFRDGMMISDVDPTIRRKLEQARYPGSSKSYFQVLTETLPNAIPSVREAQAYAFGSLLDASRRGTPMTGLKPAFARFVNFTKNFFSKLGSKLRGDGFQTAEEVLGRAGSEARTRFDQSATPAAADGTATVDASARTVGPAGDLGGLGSRVRDATPSDIASKQFEIQYTQTADMITRGLQGLPIVGKRIKETAGEDLIILMQDRMLPLGRMVDVVRESGGTVVDASDVRMTEELYSGRVGAAVDDRAKRIYKPVFDEMRLLNVSVKDIDAYLYARHAPEANAFIRSINEDPSKGSGMTDQEAAAVMQRLAPQKANLDRVAKLVDAIVADTNKTRSETGLTPDHSKLNSKTKYEHYVPLRGFADADIFEDKGVESLRAGSGQGFKIRGKEDRSRMGRTSQAADILANVILQNQETVIRSEKNRVGQSLLKLIQDNPEQAKGFARILEKAPVEPRIVNGKVKLVSSGLYKNRDDVMVVKEGGNEVAIEIYDERLARALTGATGLGAENSSMVLRALAGVNRWLAMVNTTLNPEFIITNFTSDLQTANINIKQFDAKGIGRKIVSDIPSALAGARAAIRGGDTSGKWSQAYEDFRRAGGTVEFLGLRDVESKVKQINEEVMGSDGSPVKRPFKTMLKIIEDYNTVADNAIRLSTFQTLRDLGVSDAKAAQVAKNLTTNFNKAGQNRVLMNSLYLFYNASIQGTMAMANAIVRSKRVRKYVGGIIVAGFMQDVINSMMSDMDEDERKVYDKIPDHVLARNYVLMDPFGLTDRGYYTLPMPYGFNAFFNMGRNLARVSRGEGDPMKTSGSIVMGFVDAFNPIGGTQSFLNFAAPTILDPLVDLRSNLDFANRPIVPEERGFGPATPESQRFWSNTFPPYVTVAQWLNQITGGTSVIPGQVDISPNTIKYLMNYATGAAGAFAERVVKFGFSTVPDMLAGDLEEVEVRDIPLLRKLYGNVTSRNDLQDFMENTNRISQIQREFREAERFGESERIERALRDYPNELAIAPTIEGLVRARRRITREMNEIRRDPSLDEDSRKEILRLLKEEADLYVGQVNLIYNQSVDRRR